MSSFLWLVFLSHTAAIVPPGWEDARRVNFLLWCESGGEWINGCSEKNETHFEWRIPVFGSQSVKMNGTWKGFQGLSMSKLCTCDWCSKAGQMRSRLFTIAHI